MVKPVVVIADCDEDYVSVLERKFIDEFGDRIVLEIITEKQYFNEFFERPTKVEVLVVGEQLYFSELKNGWIKNIFIMYEEMRDRYEEESTIIRIPRYLSVNKIYQQIISVNDCLMKISTHNNASRTRVIVVYSPVGGIGKTTVALGISVYMGKEHKILYINAERMNTFQYKIKDVSRIPNNKAMELAEDKKKKYSTLQEMIGKDKIDYFMPFQMTLSALNLDYAIYNEIIEVVKEADEYDYIVVDADVVFDKEKAMMISKADSVILVGNQNEKTKCAMNILAENMTYDNLEKYLYICNEYDLSMDSKEKDSVFKEKVVSEYIRRINNADNIDIEELGQERDMQKVALLVM